MNDYKNRSGLTQEHRKVSSPVGTLGLKHGLVCRVDVTLQITLSSKCSITGTIQLAFRQGSAVTRTYQSS